MKPCGRPLLDDGAPMSLGRVNRRWIFLGVMVLLAGTFADRASAQEAYPAPGRTVHIIVPHGLGTGPDVLARLLGGKIAERWKTSVVIENRLGAAGDIGMAHVAAAPP